MIQTVEFSRRAVKQLHRVPFHIVVKLKSWVELVETMGLEATRRVPGYHDEPLQGKRQGQRSIRLSRSYRAIYEIRAVGQVDIVRIEEVTKHEY